MREHDTVDRVGPRDHPHPPRVVAEVERDRTLAAASSPRIIHAPMQPNAPVTRVVMNGL